MCMNYFIASMVTADKARYREQGVFLFYLFVPNKKDEEVVRGGFLMRVRCLVKQKSFLRWSGIIFGWMEKEAERELEENYFVGGEGSPKVEQEEYGKEELNRGRGGEWRECEEGDSIIHVPSVPVAFSVSVSATRSHEDGNL